MFNRTPVHEIPDSPLGTEGEETVRITISEIMKHFLTLPDIEPLALKLFNDRIPELAECTVRFLLLLGSNDHLP